MKNIQDKQKEIEEYKYQLREMHTQIESSLKTLKQNLPTYRELGMLKEDDLVYLESLTVESIDSKTFEEQIEFVTSLDTIKESIEEAQQLMLKRLEEIEGMM